MPGPHVVVCFSAGLYVNVKIVAHTRHDGETRLAGGGGCVVAGGVSRNYADPALTRRAAGRKRERMSFLARSPAHTLSLTPTRANFSDSTLSHP